MASSPPAFVAAALLGLGLGLAPLAAIGGVLALLTLLASVAVRPLRRPVPRRAATPVRGDLRLPLEPHHPAPPVAVAARRHRRAGLLAAPVTSIRLGWADEGNFPEDTPTRQAYDLLAAGLRRRVQRAVPDHRRARRRRLGRSRRRLQRALAQTAGVAAVTPPVADDPHAPGGLPHEPSSPRPHRRTRPPATSSADLRDDVIPAAVGGTGSTCR